VACSVHFIPLHLQPYYQRAYGYRPGDFPQAEQEFRACLSLPIFPGMSLDEVDSVISAVEHVIVSSRAVRKAAHVSPTT
jgi:dTDP-4-amino-4,6-dideoxygalactose transaminase